MNIDLFITMKNARRICAKQFVTHPNWALACELFGIGSTSAIRTCSELGIDPDSRVVERAEWWKPSLPDIKPANAAKVKEYPPDFLRAYDAMKWRAGSTKAAAYTQWQARMKAGASALEMMHGARQYASYCAATGCEVKMAQTFFGRGEHFSADWTVRRTAPTGKFDPVAHVNARQQGGDSEFIDIN